MNRELILEKLGQKETVNLAFEIEKLDFGWYTFRVVWSDDCGATRFSSDFSRNRFDLELCSLSKEDIVGTLTELRSSGSRCSE